MQRLSLVAASDAARKPIAMRLAAELLLTRRDTARAHDFVLAALPPAGTVVGCDEARAQGALAARVGEQARSTAALRDSFARCGPVTPGAPTAMAPSVIGRHRRVVIDAGHGGSDPGAIGPTGLREADVTLDVARRLAEQLSTRYGVQVAMTRDQNVFVPLEQRAAHANGTTADLFVSIHCNAANNREARGIAIFALEDSARVAARLTAREGELVDGDAPSGGDVSRILADLGLSRNGRDSLGFAQTIQQAMLTDARLFFPRVDDMGVHPARFHVLVTTRMPAVLVELSFISNLVEEQRLRSDQYRELLASAIARAVDQRTHGS